MTPIESFSLDEGYDAHGIHTKLTFEGDQIVKKQTFDAELMLEACAEERAATQGHRWGEMRKVGTIPMAVYALALEIPDRRDRTKYLRKWLHQNPKLVSFDKYLR